MILILIFDSQINVNILCFPFTSEQRNASMGSGSLPLPTPSEDAAVPQWGADTVPGEEQVQPQCGYPVSKAGATA